MNEVIVVGSGPSGLAAAFRLQQAGHSVRVLEKAPVPGSKLSTSERDGFVIDQGAYFLPTTHKNFFGVAEDAGMMGDVVPGGFVFNALRGGQAHRLDGDHLARDFLKTDLISTRSKVVAAKLGREALRAKKATVDRMPEAGAFDTETAEEWGRRNLNDELADYLVGATMRSIFAAESEHASRADFLAVLALFAGAKLVAFRDGMGHYARRMEEQLDITCDAEVLEVRETPGGASVSWRGPDGESTDEVAGCVVAVPAAVAVELCTHLDPWRAGVMRRMHHGRLFTVNVGLSRAPQTDATYTMIARPEHEYLGGFVCDHNKAPGRAPEGKGLLTLTLVNPWCEAHWEEDDDAVMEASLAALEHVLPGSADQAEFVNVMRWDQEYSPVGHYRSLAEFRHLCATRDSTVQLAGDYQSSQNLSAATATGERAARLLAAALN